MEELSAAGHHAAHIAKTTLRASLKVAMRAKDTLRVRVLRALIAALDDAETPPAGGRHDRYKVHAFADRSAEVQRLRLSDEAVREVVCGEVRARRAAADEMAELHETGRADGLRREADVIETWLAARRRRRSASASTHRS